MVLAHEAAQAQVSARRCRDPPPSSLLTVASLPQAEAGKFLTYEKVGDDIYGVRSLEVRAVQGSGSICVVEADSVKEVEDMKAAGLDANYVFIGPDDVEAMEASLREATLKNPPLRCPPPRLPASRYVVCCRHADLGAEPPHPQVRAVGGGQRPRGKGKGRGRGRHVIGALWFQVRDDSGSPPPPLTPCTRPHRH